ncbi:S41 family peptidase [Arthrobacter mangrovi]|uniref:Tricorn protease homolog n=1 Tax=Arthrobacter mangrovi TaxID=2966350 RepID=A0ABQ5MQB8_9MICC|nr:S41 family peptidase [Arthrobacter mangrovi]GLB66178.1 tricorn protease [Arthrobacter mangrovi]
MTSSSYFRYPHLHAGLVTFIAEDDVWVAPVDGGRAWRVSSLQLPARNPRFSPDGSQIAWSVVQGSAPEAVAASADGGDFRQLTYWGHATTRVKGFTSAGEAIVTSAFQREESRHTWAHAVPLDGAVPRLLNFGPLDTIAFGPSVGDERPVVVGSVLSREPAWWKRYRGGTAGKLWIDRDGSGQFARLVPQLNGNLTDPMWIGGRIAFLSDHEGYGNLYSVLPDGSGLRRHTDHEDFYVRHASTDGQRVVFESAGELWLADDLDAEPRKLELTLGSASTARRRRPLNVERHLAAAVPNRDGTASVVETHGTVHWLTHRDGPSRVVKAAPGVRARLARPLGDDAVIYVADHGGAEALYVRRVFEDLPLLDAEPQIGGEAPASGEAEPLPQPVSASAVLGRAAVAVAPAPAVAAGSAETQSGRSWLADDEAGPVPARGGGDTPVAPSGTRIDFPEPTRVSQLCTSPDGKLAAVATEYGQLLLLEAESKELRELASTGHGAINDVAFSPDSNWVLWSEPVTAEGARTKLRIGAARGGDAVHDITDGRFRDHSPAFTPDGKFAAFLSERSFDPVYDTHSFDLSFPQSTKPFLVALDSATPSPFGPAVHGTVPEAEPRNDADGGSAAQPARTAVDPVQLAGRIIPIPVAQGRYSDLSAVDGALLWLASDLAGVTGEGRASAEEPAEPHRLERFDISRREVTVLVPALDSYLVSGDRKRLVYVNKRKVRSVPTAAKVEEDSPENVQVDLGRIRVQLEPLKVWGQAFDEAWRLQRDFFWAKDMAGLDWEQVYSRYRPLVDRLGSHDDLVDLLWELHGELGTSHAYVTPAPAAEPGAGKQGLLGADLAVTPAGWTVQRVLAGESSDPLARSPLAAPGAGVKPGDVIAAVDGVPVDRSKGPAPLLSGAAGKTVELTIVNGPDSAESGRQRRIAVVPISDEERLRYQNWVAGNRRIVQEASEGRFGYLHIPDMVARGWSQLHRDLDVETARDALIIDVRSNRGGHTSQLVAELIGRKVTAWNLARGEQPGTYPAHAPRGPVVMLTDEYAGSDGDIITQVAKLRGIGPVVGTRTWGGVVGIDGRFSLVDGTGVTQPRYAFWFTQGVGWTVENYGVDPDIEVPFPPHAYAAGEDPQLEHGVGILKEMLQELPTDRPPALAGYPSLRTAPLPPRPQGS